MKLDNRLNAMTVDVEDYFQVSAFEGVIDRKDWDSISLRVGDNTHRLLDLFAENDVKATFFTESQNNPKPDFNSSSVITKGGIKRITLS